MHIEDTDYVIALADPGETVSVAVNLPATVPGHRAAGMDGTLTAV